MYDILYGGPARLDGEPMLTRIALGLESEELIPNILEHARLKGQLEETAHVLFPVELPPRLKDTFVSGLATVQTLDDLCAEAAEVYRAMELPQVMKDSLVEHKIAMDQRGIDAFRELLQFIKSDEKMQAMFSHYVLRLRVHPQYQTECDYLYLIDTIEREGTVEDWEKIRPIFDYVLPCCRELSVLEYVDRMDESDARYRAMDRKTGLLYQIKELDKRIAAGKKRNRLDYPMYSATIETTPVVQADGSIQGLMGIIASHTGTKEPTFVLVTNTEAGAYFIFYDVTEGIISPFDPHSLMSDTAYEASLESIQRTLAQCRETLSPAQWQEVRYIFGQFKPAQWHSRSLGLSGLVESPSTLEMLTTSSDAWGEEHYALLDALRETDRHFARKNGYDSLTDILCDVGIPEQALENRELWNYVKTIQQTGVVSRWKNFDAVTKDGRHVHIKISDNKARAQMEAAANYYLSSHMSFIVPGLYPEPLEANGVYVVVQEKLPETAAQIIPPVEYWMTAFAMFHKEAEGILHTAGIEVPVVKLRSLDQLEEMYAKARTREIPFDKERVRAAIEYLEAGERCATHGDAKSDNIIGGYLIDLELTGKRHAAVDLAMVLMQYNVPREQWDAHLTLYARHKGGDVNKQVRELREAVEHAVVYTAFNEICGSSLRLITPQTARENAVLTSYLSAA